GMRDWSVTGVQTCALPIFTLLAAASGGAYEVGVVRDGGTIAGRVKFVGKPPKLAPIPVNKNRDVCGERKPSEALLLSADRGVKEIGRAACREREESWAGAR